MESGTNLVLCAYAYTTVCVKHCKKKVQVTMDHFSCADATSVCFPPKACEKFTKLEELDCS